MSIAPPPTVFASPIETASRNQRAAGGEDAAQFSYALAAASLEQQASQSLKAHGATPDAKPGAIAPPRQQSPDSAQVTAESEVPHGPNRAGEPTSAPVVAPAQHSHAAAAPSAHTKATSTLAPQIAAGSAPNVAKASGPVTPQDMLPAKSKVAPSKTPHATVPATTVRTEFAEILARRLEKTSVFDLRLDPPELGRVEGRLVIGDDGKSVLSLTFDNQNAFDLLSRDEQALRDALAQAGLKFDAGDFVFSFRKQSQPEGSAPGFFAPPTEPSLDYEPLSLANWSAGALDIRI